MGESQRQCRTDALRERGTALPYAFLPFFSDWMKGEEEREEEEERIWWTSGLVYSVFSFNFIMFFLI